MRALGPANAYVNNADAGAFGAPQRKAIKCLCGLPLQLKIRVRGSNENIKLSSPNIYSPYL